MKTRNSKGQFIPDVKHYIPCSLCGKIIELGFECEKLKRKFCSHNCYIEYRNAHPELYPVILPDEETRKRMSERHKKYMGNPKNLKKISMLTKKAMYRADVQAKIHKPKGPMPESRKSKQSDLLVGKRPKNLTMFMSGMKYHSKHGEIRFKDGRSFFMRSTWERNFARYLEFMVNRGEIKEWEYEPQRFFFEGISFGNRTYLPDFRITNIDGSQYYVEVKGFMDKSSKVKIKRFLKYYPGLELQIVDQERYASISKIAPFIPTWENCQTTIRARRWREKNQL